jgi:plastocyanin
MKAVLIAAVLGSFLMLQACSGGPTEPGTVVMTSSNEYSPSEITVQAGDTLVFRNDSNAAHSVTAYDDGIPEGAAYFSSGGFNNEQAARDGVGATLIQPKGSFELTLDMPGNYRYFCIPHEAQNMKGTITVE